MTEAVDLDAYFARIGYAGPRTATVETLHDLMSAHVQSVPFENLDVLLGRGISLEPEATQRKLVVERRGGYCFEQNGLLLLVLRQLGYAVTPLSARVRYQRPRDYTPARTHLFLRVTIDDVPWVADVGVGGLSLTSAIRFDVEGEQPTRHEPRRLIVVDGRHFHQARLGAEWHDVLEFTGEEMPPIDRELANWFTPRHRPVASPRRRTHLRMSHEGCCARHRHLVWHRTVHRGSPGAGRLLGGRDHAESHEG